MKVNFTNNNPGLPIEYRRVQRFKRLLRERGVTLGKLSVMLDMNRTHLSQVISGKRNGRHTWKRLKRVLTVDEWNVLHGTTCAKSYNEINTEAEEYAIDN